VEQSRAKHRSRQGESPAASHRRADIPAPELETAGADERIDQPAAFDDDHQFDGARHWHRDWHNSEPAASGDYRSVGDHFDADDVDDSAIHDAADGSATGYVVDHRSDEHDHTDDFDVDDDCFADRSFDDGDGQHRHNDHPAGLDDADHPVDDGHHHTTAADDTHTDARHDDGCSDNHHNDGDDDGTRDGRCDWHAGSWGILLIMEKMPYRPELEVIPVQAAFDNRVDSVHSDWRDGLPVLHGERVVLRELRASDAASLFALLTTEEVSRFISPPPTSVEGFERFIAWTLRQRTAGTYACFAVTLRGFDTAIGIFQIRQLEPGFGTAEWGFAMGSQFWGTGVFQEGAELVLDFAFDTIGVHRLEARAAVLNGRGNGALQKLGAVQECVLRKSFRRNGQYLDQVLYAILDSDRRELAASVRVH